MPGIAGTGNDEVREVTTDAAGNLDLIGTTTSTDAIPIADLRRARPGH
jgi:hypothetical protein